MEQRGHLTATYLPLLSSGSTPNSLQRDSHKYKKVTVSITYFYILKSCDLINVATEGHGGAATVMNQNERVFMMVLGYMAVLERRKPPQTYACAFVSL